MNALRHATSPYVQQHAHNPVAWRLWGEESLALARSEDRPIFLSIGYSACHWCHVMAHESFEDEQTAAFLNRHFISIKLDREERPDLDHIYQVAHQILTGRGGGWPLSIFLTPTLQPFFSGTYFPKEPRYGMPSFQQVLSGVIQTYQERRSTIDKQALAVTGYLQNLQRFSNKPSDVTSDPLLAQAEKILETFDPVYGGFGGAPKFPRVADMALLLRLGYRMRSDTSQDEQRYLQPVAHTLDQMIGGGIMDQIGGGFARYSVDEMWRIPHFEKMLYDNGLMLHILAEADALLGIDPERRRARLGIVAWLKRRMTLADGGFAASLDADSDGGEGHYYLWTPESLNQHLTSEEAELATAAWGVTQPGNFEGHTHLTRALSVPVLQERFGQDAVQRLQKIADQLLQARQKRAKPGRDDKVLTGWNALIIRGLLRHGVVENDSNALEMAQRALQFLTTHLRDDNGWLAVWRDGRRHTQAFLDDHAYLLEAFLDASVVFPSGDWLRWAEVTAQEMLSHFSDVEGGLFFTPEGQKDVIVRTKSGSDAATPSGNGFAATALLRLASATDNPLYRQAAEQTLTLFSSYLSAHGHAQLALASDTLQHGTTEVVAAGIDLLAFARTWGSYYFPDPVFIGADRADNLPQHLQGRLQTEGAALCTQGRCLPAVQTLEAWRVCLREVNG